MTLRLLIIAGLIWSSTASTLCEAWCLGLGATDSAAHARAIDPLPQQEHAAAQKAAQKAACHFNPSSRDRQEPRPPAEGSQPECFCVSAEVLPLHAKALDARHHPGTQVALIAGFELPFLTDLKRGRPIEPPEGLNSPYLRHNPPLLS